MGADQEGTLAALRQLRSELFGPTVAGHRGKVVKSMGDGWLVEFSSAVDAVTCAMQIQDRLAGHETIRLRIGIHLGDIIHEDEDIFGDGVNIAARLQEAAEPDAVVISDAVFSSLDGTLTPSFDDQGQRALKNIARPVRLWARGGGAARPTGVTTLAERTGFPVLIVQPVASSDAREEVQELAAALTGDLGSYLGAAHWLVTRTADAADPLAYVLGSALRGRGERLRLEVRLDEPGGMPGGAPAWSAKFDGTLADSFDWQDRVGEEIAGQVIGLILERERRKLAGRTADEMTAEQCNLRGLMEVRLVDRAGTAASLGYLAAAIEKNPAAPAAYAHAIFLLISAEVIGLGDVARQFRSRLEGWVTAAEPLAQSSPMLELAVAIVRFYREGDAPRLRRAVRDALREAPFGIDALMFCGSALIWLGEPEAALDCLRRSERLDRFNPWCIPMKGVAALACVQAGRDDEAVAWANAGLEVTTGFPTLYRTLAVARAHQGRLDEARAAMAELLRIVPDETVSIVRARAGAPDRPGFLRLLDGLALAGMPE